MAIFDTTEQIGLLEGLCSTRAIRRYKDEPIPDEALCTMLFAATRGPSGSNRQPFRFLVLRQGELAGKAKKLIAESAQALWAAKSKRDQYEKGSGKDPASPKARMARTMQFYVDNFSQVPCLILPCLVRHRAPQVMEGASIYPAVQNLLLAARGLGYGGVITGFHLSVEAEIKQLLSIPEEVFISSTVTLGRPVGQHGPVRRRPIKELIFENSWGDSPSWALDPAGVAFTSAGPRASTSASPPEN